MEEERNVASMPVMADAKFSQAPGHSSTMIATPVIQSARGMAAVSEHSHIMAKTAESVHKMAANNVPFGHCCHSRVSSCHSQLSSVSSHHS